MRRSCDGRLVKWRVITNQGLSPIPLLATAVVLMVGHLQLRAEPVAQNRPLPPAIAVSKSATLVERNAATELAEYLRRITGRDFPVATTDSVTGKALFAVGPGAAKAAAPDLDLSKASLGNDGIVLKTVGEAVILTGAEGAVRGTLYAVYEFLEKVGGVRGGRRGRRRCRRTCPGRRAARRARTCRPSSTGRRSPRRFVRWSGNPTPRNPPASRLACASTDISTSSRKPGAAAIKPSGGATASSPWSRPPGISPRTPSGTA